MSIASILPTPSFSIDNATTKRKMAFRGNMKVMGGIETSGTFAKDIVSRINPASFENPSESPANGSLLANGNTDDDHAASYVALGKKSKQGIKDSSALEASLKDTIDHVAQKYGYKAATAVMGSVYQSVSEKGVTEENLGQGFLESVKIIDSNFGVDEGNNFMEELNSGINNNLNTYFDNGKNETFFDAATLNPDRLMAGAAAAIAKAFGNAGAGSAEAEDADNSSDSSSGNANIASTQPSTSDSRLAALKAKAKKLVATGQIPPGYENQYIQNTAPGMMIDTTV